MRKVHFSSCVVIAACAWMIALRDPQARARDEESAARLTRQIDPLAAVFRPGAPAASSQTVADALIDNKARTQLFRLESLLRLYGRAHSDLEKYRREVKRLEDGLGAYTFAADSVSFAEDRFKEENRAQAPDATRTAGQANVLDRLREEKAAAHGTFSKLVEKSTFGSDLPRLRSLVVSRLAGWSASRDLTYVKSELQGVLKKVRDGRLDLNRLEDGIHEFRRQLRWFPVLIDSLDGLILVRDDPPGACPVPALEGLSKSAAAKHRYSNPALRFPAAHPCAISRCLLWQVVQTTNDLGQLKDEAQGNNAIASALDNDIYVPSNKTVTPEEIARAKAIRTEFFASHALDALMTQLSSCTP